MEPVPFAEAIAFAKSRKVVLPEVYYGQLVGVARAQSFSVAGVASLDQLQRVLNTLSEAMETGASFAEWKKQVRSGEIGLNLPDHRLDNIFRTNLQTHYSRGRAEQQRRNREQRPYFLWDATNDHRTRPTHAAMDGYVALQDDPIWKKWSAPAGYRCRCRRIALSAKQAERFRKADESKLARDSEAANARRQALTDGPDEGFGYDILEDFGEGVRQTVERRRNTVNHALINAMDRKLSQAPSRLSLDEMMGRGDVLVGEISSAANAQDTSTSFYDRFRAALAARLEREGIQTSTPAKVASRGKGAELVKQASLRFPDSWTKKADQLGELRVTFSRDRAFHVSLTEDHGLVKVPGFGVLEVKAGFGLLSVSDISSAVHEYTHRLQHAMPELDDYFQALHQRRTAGDDLKQLAVLYNDSRYEGDEVAREDDYVTPYFGKEYNDPELSYTGRVGALEVITMTYECLLSAAYLEEVFDDLYKKDRELFNLAISLLFNHQP
jgi:SPP1 gp7 family putative phage head morphogenesis protein